MKLSVLTDEAVSPDPDITGLTADSRAVVPGFLFAALSGVHDDGARFAQDAVSKGARAVLCGGPLPFEPPASVPVIVDALPRKRLAQMAARFYRLQPSTMVGVTGTNGKTSTAIFTRQLWSSLGNHAASLGTLGCQSEGWQKPLKHTTPDPVTLHETLAEAVDQGVTHLAMEVSSHALAQYRADGIAFAGAGFTNITQDHLDYHTDFDDYFDTKARLFADLVRLGGFAAINMDGEGADKMRDVALASGLNVLTTGRHGEDIVLRELVPTSNGLALTVEAGGKTYETALPLIGDFQAENALLAAAIVIAGGAPVDGVMAALASLKGAPGRMEYVGSARGGSVYVDYAHTPDAVATALKAIRPHAAGRVIAIIGAGGDRDRAKRPLMGRAAAEYADIVIVTDDNPRTEEPAAIRAEVMAGASNALEIDDRAEAIAAGAAQLQNGDILLVAGKGHETGQIVGDNVLPFDDVKVARAAIDRLNQMEAR